MKTITNSYIRGFADGEGSVGKQQIRIVNTDLRVLRLIQHKLIQLGINNFIHKKKKECNYYKQAYSIDICGRKNLKLFLTKIGFSIVDKQRKLVNLLLSYRKIKLTLKKLRRVGYLYKQGFSIRSIAKQVNLSSSYIHYILLFHKMEQSNHSIEHPTLEEF